MDHGRLSWEMVAIMQIRAEGKEGKTVKPMLVYRGDVVDTVSWGIVDKDAEAIPAGVRVRRCPRTVCVEALV